MSSQRREPAPASVEHGREAQQEAEIPGDLLTHVATGSAAQVVIAVVIVLAVCYVAKLVMITIASALLLAFVLEPVVWRLPTVACATGCWLVYCAHPAARQCIWCVPFFL